MDKKKPMILIVDDNPLNLQIMAEVVEEDGYESVLAMNAKQAFEYISNEKPDLILLDVMMPDMDGYHVCKIFKKDNHLKDIPVIFLTAKSETEDLVKGFEAGGVDYVTKPFNPIELKMRIKTHLELKKSQDGLRKGNKQLRKTNEELREANEVIAMRNEQLKELMQKLDLTSRIDSLTGLFNRRHIMEKIQEEAVRFKRNKKLFSFIISDVDFFKKINDTYGHYCGDFVLQQVAKILNKNMREQDVLARWGGEEFLMLLPETDLNGASILAERIRNYIEKEEFHYNEIKLLITMTFGVSSFDGNDDIDHTIKKADDALYEGKANNKNCVVLSK